MSREIKFRVWNKSHNLMFGWDYLQAARALAIDPSLDANSFMVVPTLKTDVLMQFTGLKDKKNKEIYEGDIVHFPLEESGDYKKDIVGQVKWENEDAGFYVWGAKTGWSIGYGLELEVIGNIYQNADLLTG